jgi:hypothetical protein
VCALNEQKQIGRNRTLKGSSNSFVSSDRQYGLEICSSILKLILLVVPFISVVLGQWDKKFLHSRLRTAGLKPGKGDFIGFVPVSFKIVQNDHKKAEFKTENN